MNFPINSLKASTPRAAVQEQPAAKAEQPQDNFGAIKDFFTYTSRDSDPHEGFFEQIGKDMAHAAPFAAKLTAAGVLAGLGTGLLVGSAVAMPIVGGVAGLMTSSLIADKADNARDMKTLAAIAGWTN